MQLQKSHAADSAQQWGNLPMKEQREVMESTRKEMPLRWRDRLEKYFRRLNNPDRK